MVETGGEKEHSKGCELKWSRDGSVRPEVNFLPTIKVLTGSVSNFLFFFFFFFLLYNFFSLITYWV